ncbi:MAG TPA: NAD-binding protein [Anaerolineaceae bacterium]
MYVVIISAGRTGAHLANLLLSQDHEVRIIENRKDVLGWIHKELPSEVVIEGDPLDPTVLEQAGIRQADVVAAVTTSDEMNLVQCYLARTTYGVTRTIARVNNPRNAWLFNDTFRVDVAVNQASIMATLIEEEMNTGDMITLLKLRHGKYLLVEETVQAGAKGVGLAIKDTHLPEHCVIAAISRKGEIIVPRGLTVFEEGDQVMAVTDAEGARVLCELFEVPEIPAARTNGNGHS